MSTIQTNLVSHWKLDESSGNAADSKGVNTLTNNNSTAYAAAKLNNGADFEASSVNSLSIADASQVGLDLATDFSFSCWLNLESVSGNMILIEKRTGGNGYTIGFTNDITGVGGGAGFFTTIQGTDVNYNKTLNTATWYHIVCVYTKSAGTIDVYINGTLDHQIAAQSTALAASTAAFFMGGRTASFSLDGLMDEVDIWDRAITTDEITFLYNSGTPIPYPYVQETTKTEVAGIPVEAVTMVKSYVLSTADVSGVPVDSADLDYGWQEASKSSAPTWTPQPKS